MSQKLPEDDFKWVKIKLVANLLDKKKNVIHMKSLKQALIHWIGIWKFHRIIKFHEKKKAKNDFEKDFFKLINNAPFGKTTENVRIYRDIKLIKIKARRNFLVSEPSFHTTNIFSENLFLMEMKKDKDLWIN